MPRTPTRAANPRKRPRSVLVQVPIHAELHRLLVFEGLAKQWKLPAAFHVALCERFNRPDLIDEVPLSRRQRA